MPFGPRQTEYRESIYVGYRYYDSADVAVAYPFGHGLSYTSFEWSDASAVVVDTATVQVGVTVTNTGPRPGSEVVQAYVRDVSATVFRPAQELKGFAKLHLGSGEAGRATLTLDRRAFAFWDVTAHDWTVEAGEFEIRLGASSRDIRAKLLVRLEAPPVADLDPGPPSYHDIGKASFSREDFALLYGRPLPDNVPDAPGAYTMNTPIADLKHPLARVLLRVLRWGARWAVRGPGDSPAMLLVDRTVEDATPRMLSMFLGRAGSLLARVLVRFANGPRAQ
jgi:beta-glucosidase